MKKTKLTLILCGLMMATVLFISSCQKKTTTTTTPPPPDTNTSSATDNNTSEGASKDLMNIGSESIDNGSLSTYRLSGGMLSPLSGSITITPNPTAKTVTIAFVNFVGRDGNTRNGTVLYDWSGSTGGATYFKDAGFCVYVTTPLNDYTVGNATSGTFTITINKKHVRNLGAIGGNYTWSDTANLTIVKPSSGGTITWNRTGTMVLLNTSQITYNGVSVPGVYPTTTGFIDWTQAIIGFTGNASGANAGSSYTANITSRVEYNFNCSPTSYPFFHPPVAGSIDFTPSGKPTRTINYGTGTCDDTYTVTIGTYSVTLSFI